MEITIHCNRFGCPNDCDEHAYCDAHYNQELEAEYERGKKEGYQEARAEFEVIN